MIVTIKSTTWITVCLFELISICTLKCNYQWCNMWFCCMSTSSRYPSIFLSRSFSSSYSLILPRSVSVYLSRLYYHISTFFFIWIFFYLDVMFDLYVIIVSSFFYIIRFFISKEISIHSYISLFPNFIFHFHCVPFRTSTGNTISSIQSLFSPSLTWSLCWFHVIYVKVLSLEVLSSAALMVLNVTVK